MNIYRTVLNAVSGVVYRGLVKRDPGGTPDRVKLEAWLRKRGWKNEHVNRIKAKGNNREQAEEIKSLLRAIDEEKRK